MAGCPALRVPEGLVTMSVTVVAASEKPGAEYRTACSRSIHAGGEGSHGSRTNARSGRAASGIRHWGGSLARVDSKRRYRVDPAAGGLTLTGKAVEAACPDVVAVKVSDAGFTVIAGSAGTGRARRWPPAERAACVLRRNAPSLIWWDLRHFVSGSPTLPGPAALLSSTHLPGNRQRLPRHHYLRRIRLLRHNTCDHRRSLDQVRRHQIVIRVHARMMRHRTVIERILNELETRQSHIVE